MLDVIGMAGFTPNPTWQSVRLGYQAYHIASAKSCLYPLLPDIDCLLNIQWSSDLTCRAGLLFASIRRLFAHGHVRYWQDNHLWNVEPVGDWCPCDLISCALMLSMPAGTYFARASRYSEQYCRAARSGTESRQHLQGENEQVLCPAFLPDARAMLLCRVALGKIAQGSQQLRRPPAGFDSVTNSHPDHPNAIFAVFDNNQSYPEYIVHFE